MVRSATQFPMVLTWFNHDFFFFFFFLQVRFLTSLFFFFFFGQIAITRILFVSICDNTYTKSIRVIAKKCTCYREKWSKKYTCYREQKCTCFLLLRCSLSIPRPSNFFLGPKNG